MRCVRSTDGRTPATIRASCPPPVAGSVYSFTLANPVRSSTNGFTVSHQSLHRGSRSPPALPIEERTICTEDTSDGTRTVADPVLQQVTELLDDSRQTDRGRMERALVRLARWRQQLLTNTYRKLHGNQVFSGPFADMLYGQATEGATLQRLMGCYAVGFARFLSHCTVVGFDLSEAARTA